MLTWIILGVIVLALLYGVAVYNRLVRLRALVREAFSGITVQLRRRADLVPNLVSTVQGYAAHEQNTLTAVVNARAKATAVQVNASDIDNPEKMRQFQEAQAQLSGALGRLLVVVRR